MWRHKACSGAVTPELTYSDDRDYYYVPCCVKCMSFLIAKDMVFESYDEFRDRIMKVSLWESQWSG
jgi:hypothetical protein